MPLITIRTSQAGATFTENVLTGSQYEILTHPCAVSIGLTQDGGTIGDIVCTIYTGGIVIAEEQPISAQNRIPINPDDFLAHFVGAAMDRLKVKIRNTTAATTRVVLTTVVCDPL